MSQSLILFVVSTCCIGIVRTMVREVPSDVRLRALTAVVLALALVIVEGAAPQALVDLPGISRSVGMLVIAIAAGLSWRIPDRIQSWGTELGEVAMLLTTVIGVALDGATAGVGTAVAAAICVAWAVAGTLAGRTAGASRSAAGPILALGVLGATAASYLLPATVSAVVASTALTLALALERRPPLAVLGPRLGRAALGAAAVVAATWLVGLPLDARVLLPALVGAWLGDATWVRPSYATSPAEAEPAAEPLEAERETLAVLGRLADPLRDTGEPLLLSLEHVLPGCRIELLRSPDAPPGIQGPGRRIEPELLSEVCRRGALSSASRDALSPAVALALRKLGPDVTLLPVVYEARVYGALLVRGARGHDGLRAQARRFADLLGHRLEAQRLYTELQHKQRLATLGTFAAALVHDLRTPLATMRLDMQLLQRTTSPYEREALADAIRALDRVLDDLSGTLDFTRPLELDIATLDMAALANEVVISQRPQAERRGVTLHGHAAPSEPARVRGDRQRLLRVLENLLRNALDVSPVGASVVVALVVTADAVEVTVTDQGPGIDPSLGERVFEPFVTTKREGVGLGLAVVRKIVETHNGRVVLDSALGVGTHMKVWLPRARV
jgi:signal transduction histidine kinase